MILKNVLAIAEEAYQQEQERMKSLNQKADNLTRYVSIFLVLLNIILPLVVKYTQIKFILAVFAYIFVCVPSIISLIFAIKEQRLSTICRFPDGHSLIKVASEENLKTNDEWLKYKISQYDLAIKTLEQNNDEKVKDIKIGYGSYILSVIMLTLFTLWIIIAEYII